MADWKTMAEAPKTRPILVCEGDDVFAAMCVQFGGEDVWAGLAGGIILMDEMDCPIPVYPDAWDELPKSLKASC